MELFIVTYQGGWLLVALIAVTINH